MAGAKENKKTKKGALLARRADIRHYFSGWVILSKVQISPWD